MKLPNFLIVGAAKAGTSSLHYYLKQHPQIYMSSLKEPKFFAFEGEDLDFQGPASNNIKKFSVTTLEQYQQLFAGVTDEIAIGEASPIYFEHPKAAQRIKSYLPDVKIIAVIRHPAERAFSAFSHLVREGYETLSFEEALQKETERINQKWIPLFYYQQIGFYYTHLKRYFELFEREQIKIYLYEELATNSIDVIQDIFDFLNVERDFIPDLTQKNVSGIPRSRLLYDLFTKNNFIKDYFKPFFSSKLRRKIYHTVTTKTLKPKPILELETKSNLIEIYRKDIINLQDLIQRDLSAWLA
jgi:hypothetical protein